MTLVTDTYSPETNYLPATDRTVDWMGRARVLSARFSEVAARVDSRDEFVAENYAELQRAQMMSVGIPRELGGGGASFSEVCSILRVLAHGCPSTALAFSMHQHVVAAQLWNHRQGKPGRAVLELVAKEQIVLVSTGAGDWLDSSGCVEAVDGGFLVSGKKSFASGSPAATVMVTSAPFEDPESGWRVLHFPVPFAAEGVELQDDWKVLGMRGTGSQSVRLKEVFVPAEKVALSRPRGEYHPLWNTVLTIALPMICSVYTGIAERAAELASTLGTRRASDETAPYSFGEMANALVTCQIASESLVENALEGHFDNDLSRANAALIRKTLVVDAAQETTRLAMEATGGVGFFRGFGLEQLWRDVQAGAFHPLPKRKQHRFTGRITMGLEPVG